MLSKILTEAKEVSKCTTITIYNDTLNHSGFLIHFITAFDVLFLKMTLILK